MKRFLSILLCLALLCGWALAEPASAGEGLGFALLRELHAGGGNVMLSPASLALALGMAAEGASGERVLRQGDLVISTAQQLTDGMILPDT